MSDHLSQRVERGLHPCLVGAAQHPRRLLVDIAVGVCDDAPDRLECEVKGLLGDMVANDLEEAMRRTPQRRVSARKRHRFRHLGTAIAVDHDQHALRQVPEIIGEVTVEATNHRAVREVAVIAERQLAQ